MTSAELKERAMQAIRGAFSDVSYPGDGAIVSPSEGWQEDDINQDFRGLHWCDAPRELLEKYDFVLPYFSPAGRHFYLPAFLLYRLQELRKDSFDWVLRQLEPPEDMDRFKREYDAYTPAQRDAIRLFLECICDEALHQERYEWKQSGHFAQKALKRYWARQGAELTHAMPEPARRAQIRQAILSAFADVPYPGDHDIAYSSTAWDGIAINHDFKGYHWRDLPRGLLAFHHDVLSFFSIEGLHFFLPAYLLTALEDLHDIRRAVLWRLEPQEDLDDFKLCFDGYTAAQKTAIRMFLEYARDEEPYGPSRYRILIALDRYWTGNGNEQPKPNPDPAQRERMRQTILNAFADVAYPGDEAISWKSPRDPDRGQELDQDFKGRHFRDVPRDVLIRHHNELASFSEEGLLFYLPAYLLAAVDDIYDIVYYVVYYLDLTDWNGDALKRQFDRFSPVQKRAIRLFLEHVRDAMPQVSLADLAQKALAQYWASAAP